MHALWRPFRGIRWDEHPSDHGPFGSAVAQRVRLAPEHAVQVDRVHDDHRQRDRHTDEDDGERTGGGGRVPHGEPADHDVGKDAVGQAEEGQHEDQHRVHEHQPAITGGDEVRPRDHPLHREEGHRADQRHRQQGKDLRQTEPFLEHRRAHQRRGHRDGQQRHAHGPQRAARPAHRLLLQLAVGLHDQPARAEQQVGRGQRDGDAQAEQQAEHAGVEARDVAAQHPALRGAGGQRAGEEGAVPERQVLRRRLDAEVEGHAAQDQADDHDGCRQVQGLQHQAVRLGKGHQQHAHAQDQPGFVGVPERADAADHGVFLHLVAQRQQQAHAKVVAVENHIGQQRKAHHGHEDQGEEFGPGHVVSPLLAAAQAPALPISPEGASGACFTGFSAMYLSTPT